MKVRLTALDGSAQYGLLQRKHGEADQVQSPQSSHVEPVRVDGLLKGETARSYQLACTEVWGSNSYVSSPFELPGLTGWVYSNPQGLAGVGGDLHYLSLCSEGNIARVVLADVSGHGEKASSAAVDLRLLMRKYINSLDQADFMSELNRAFLGASNGEHYASVVALSHRHSTGELVFTNAGHPPPFWRRGPENTWIPLEESLPRAKGRLLSVPVGMMPFAEYVQTRVQWAIGDLLLLYTDGLTEAINHLGEELGWQALLQVTRDARTGSPAALGSAVLAAVDSFRMGARPTDDETLVVLQRSEEETYLPREPLWSQKGFAGRRNEASNGRVRKAQLFPANIKHIKHIKHSQTQHGENI